jgi:hypothetical protein
MPGLLIASLIYWTSIFIALVNYGAVNLLTVTLLAFPIFLLLPTLLLWRGVSRHTQAALWLAGAILVLSLAWITFQTTPLPDGVFAQPAWREIQDMHPGTRPVISLTPANDWASALRIVVPLGVFMVGILLYPTDKRAMQALKIICVSGGAISFVSIAQFIFAPNALLFDAKIAYLDSLTGFFVNRNTAATYFGIIVLLSMSMARIAFRGIALSRVIAVFNVGGAISPENRRAIVSATFYLGLLLSSLVALMLTKSRGGIASTFVGILLVIVLGIFRSPMQSKHAVLTGTRRRGLKRLPILACLLIVVPIGFLSVGERVLLRTQAQDAADDGRFCVMPGIISATRDHFPFGTGLASFPEVFPAYRDARCGIIGVWDMAHNVYLEGIFTLGVAFVILASTAVIWLSGVFVVGMKRRRSVRFAGELGMASLVLIGIHSALDFSLQISGVSILYAALLAPIVTLCLRPPQKSMTMKNFEQT